MKKSTAASTSVANRSVKWDPCLPEKAVKDFFHADSDANAQTIHDGKELLNLSSESSDENDQEEEEDSDFD